MSNDKKTLIEQFVIECGKYGDTAQIPFYVIEKYNSKERANIRIAELDAIESTIVKHCAELSTQQANDKEVFRQQIIQTYIDAQMERNLVKKHFAYFLKLERVTEKAKQYYNQTYNEQR
jgi:hypothetical protein